MPLHLIPFEDAIAMAARYRNNKEQVLDEQFRNQDLLPLSETFDKDVVEELLKQEGCKYLRIYYGMAENLQTHAILVAADEKGEDILPPDLTSENKGELMEDSFRCPSDCPPPSPLNS